MVMDWHGAVARASAAFEGRYTYGARRRVDRELADALREQVALFGEALVTQESGYIDLQGAATLRGFAAATEAMMQQPDDAYLMGQGRNGTQIAIGHSPASSEAVRARYGAHVTFVTPDELADMIEGLEAFRALASVRKLFPAAQMIIGEDDANK